MLLIFLLRLPKQCQNTLYIKRINTGNNLYRNSYIRLLKEVLNLAVCYFFYIEALERKWWITNILFLWWHLAIEPRRLGFHYFYIIRLCSIVDWTHLSNKDSTPTAYTTKYHNHVILHNYSILNFFVYKNVFILHQTTAIWW